MPVRNNGHFKLYYIVFSKKKLIAVYNSINNSIIFSFKSCWIVLNSQFKL